MELAGEPPGNVTEMPTPCAGLGAQSPGLVHEGAVPWYSSCPARAGLGAAGKWHQTPAFPPAGECREQERAGHKAGRQGRCGRILPPAAIHC